MVVLDNLNAHVSGAMAELIAARDWLTACRLRNIGQFTALVKTRLKRMQYRPGLLEGFLAKTDLDLTLCNSHH